MTPYPPQVLAPDPIALYRLSDEPGNGPVVVKQTSPAAGDTIVRNSEGYWINQAPSGAGAWALGNLRQEGNTARPARTSWIDLPAFSALKDETAALIKKEAIMVPIPVLPGDVFSKVAVLVGGTAAETPTHQWGALYEGALVSSEATLLSQSPDEETAAIEKEKLYAWKLKAAQTVTAAMAPHGFVYAAVQVTATVEPSLLGQTVVAAANYAWGGANSPLQGFGNKFSVSGTEGVAKSPSGALTKVNALPLVILY
jgi:hypothetical protein